MVEQGEREEDERADHVHGPGAHDEPHGLHVARQAREQVARARAVEERRRQPLDVREEVALEVPLDAAGGADQEEALRPGEEPRREAHAEEGQGRVRRPGDACPAPVPPRGALERLPQQQRRVDHEQAAGEDAERAGRPGPGR